MNDEKRRADTVIEIGRNQRAVFVGRTGTGKTTLARSLLTQYPYVVAIDPKGEFDLPNMRVAHNPEQLIHMEVKPYSPQVYRPEVELDNYETYEKVFEWIYRRQNTTVYVDEIYAIMDGPRTPTWYRAILTRGRSRNIRTLSAVQRPVSVPLNVLTESNHYIMFDLAMDDDKKRMAELMGDGVLKPLTKEFSFYYYAVGDRRLGQYILARPEV